jgi:hypothetical protein
MLLKNLKEFYALLVMVSIYSKAAKRKLADKTVHPYGSIYTNFDPTRFSPHLKAPLKGLSHEIDFKNFNKNLQNLV